MRSSPTSTTSWAGPSSSAAGAGWKPTRWRTALALPSRSGRGGHATVRSRWMSSACASTATPWPTKRCSTCSVRDLKPERLTIGATRRLGLECKLVEHPHLLTTQVAFTVTGHKRKIDEFAQGLKAEELATMRTERAVMLSPL